MQMWKCMMVGWLGCFAASSCLAQEDEMKSAAGKYPNEKAIIWNHEEHVKFSFDDGELTATSNTLEEMMMLSDEAARYYNTNSIHHSSFHKLERWQAASVIPDGNSYRTIKTTEAKTSHSADESVFYDDANETQVTYPSLIKGALTRLTYTIRHTDMHFLPGFYFQTGVPINKASFKVTVPKGVQLDYVIHGNNREWIKMSNEEGRNETVYSWSAGNVPKVKIYDDGPAASYFIPHVLIYVKNYQSRSMDSAATMFSKVPDLYSYYYPFIKKINSKPSDSLNNVVAQITKGATTDRQKAERIYQWVQQNIKYIAFEDGMGGFIPREAAAVCTRRFGDCKDMSSLLVAMCRIAGLDAYFTWIGTRRKPYTYEQVPLPIVDDHMICTVKLGSDYIFMDGTDAVIPFGNPPSGIQGKEALVGIDAKNYKIIKVPELEHKKSQVSDSTHLNLEGEMVKGSVDVLYSGYGAWRIAGMLQYRNENDMKDALKALTQRGSNKYLQTKFDYKTSAGDAKNMNLHSEFTLGDYARNVDKEWYINLNMKRTYEDEYADLKERKIPIVYSYKNKIREVVVLDIPQGYAVSYVPPDKEAKVPGLWSYKLAYQQNGKQVKLTKEYELYTLQINPEQFKDHNKLVEGLKAEYKESIVLSKSGK